MDEVDVRRTLGDLLGPRFDAPEVTEDQRCALVEAFRSCSETLFEALLQVDEPRQAARSLRLAARACRRFGGLLERIGASEKAAEVREAAREMEAAANEAEDPRGGLMRPPFGAWW